MEEEQGRLACGSYCSKNTYSINKVYTAICHISETSSANLEWAFFPLTISLILLRFFVDAILFPVFQSRCTKQLYRFVYLFSILCTYIYIFRYTLMAISLLSHAGFSKTTSDY